MNFCPGKLFLKLLARIGEWHQNLSEKTGKSTSSWPKNADYFMFIIELELDLCMRSQQKGRSTALLAFMNGY